MLNKINLKRKKLIGLKLIIEKKFKEAIKFKEKIRAISSLK